MRGLWWLPIAVLMCFGAAWAQQDNGLSAVDQRVADLEAELSYRIVGGVVAKEKAWPWQVALFKRGGGGKFYFHCGGSLIDRSWVLTAAHCISSTDPNDYVMYEGTNMIAGSGDPPGHRLAVRRIVRHEGYNPTTSENDIALIELSNEATSQAVELSSSESNVLERPGTSATVTGWGTLRATIQNGTVDLLTHENIRPGDPKYFTTRLMEVEIPLVDEDTCRKTFIHTNAVIDHRFLCAGLVEGGKDSCQGDSGGPLVAKAANGQFIQIGVVSNGIGCALKEGYGAYSRVSAFKDWIQSNAHIDPFQHEAPSQGPVASAIPPQTSPAPPTSAVPPSPSVLAPPPQPVSTSDNAAGIQVGFVQGQTLRVGQKAQFRVSAAKPGYLVLLDVAPGRQPAQIFPNKRSLSSPTGGRPRSNFIEAGHPITVPDPGNPYEGFEFTADLPAGEGKLVAILSDEPLKSVPLPDAPMPMDQPQSMDYLAHLMAELSRDLEIQGTKQPHDWSFATKTYRIVQ
jgi:secreted trypsin-like serine protease